MKKPKYDMVVRIALKFARNILKISVPHSYVYIPHPKRTPEKGKDDYAFCENCKEFAWTIKSRKCKK